MSSVGGAALFAKWVGESEKALRQVFLKAKQASPCILFFDELDTIFPRRDAQGESAGRERLVGQFIGELDALNLLSEVMVVGATNRMDLVDPALLNPGRLGMVVKLEIPNALEREEILRAHTRGLPISGTVDYGALAELTEGLNGAELAAIITSATFEEMRNFISDHGNQAHARPRQRTLGHDDFLRALNAKRNEA